MPITVGEDPPQKVVIEFTGPPLHRGEADHLELMMTPEQAESLCHILKQHNSMCAADSGIKPVHWQRYAINSRFTPNNYGPDAKMEPFWDVLEEQRFP